MINTIHKDDPAFGIITDDWHDENHIDVDDHGQETVYQVYSVDQELVADYPDLAPYIGFWGRSVTKHPYNGMVESDDTIVRVQQVEVVHKEWKPV